MRKLRVKQIRKLMNVADENMLLQLRNLYSDRTKNMTESNIFKYLKKEYAKGRLKLPTINQTKRRFECQQ